MSEKYAIQLPQDTEAWQGEQQQARKPDLSDMKPWFKDDITRAAQGAVHAASSSGETDWEAAFKALMLIFGIGVIGGCLWLVVVSLPA